MKKLRMVAAILFIVFTLSSPVKEPEYTNLSFRLLFYIVMNLGLSH
jgi:hypothetical protein